MQKVTLETIRAWVDGELSEQHSREIAARVAADPVLAEQAAWCEASKLPYKAALDQTTPPVPNDLIGEIKQWSSIAEGASEPSVERTVPQTNRRMLIFSCAATVTVLLTSLWLNASLFSERPTPITQWANAVVNYQNFYVAETIEGPADSTLASLTLSKLRKIDAVFPETVPDLTLQGYAFKRLQQLDYKGTSLLQMVFFKQGKRPLAICIMSDNQTIDASFSKHEQLNSYVWTQNGIRGIVVAEESLDEMKAIAALVDS